MARIIFDCENTEDEKIYPGVLVRYDRHEPPLWDEGDAAVLHVEDVGVDLEEGDQVHRRLEQAPAALMPKLATTNSHSLMLFYLTIITIEGNEHRCIK